METKTVILENDVHIKICRIQLDLREAGIKKTIQSICDTAIRHGIDNVYNEIVKKKENT